MKIRSKIRVPCANHFIKVICAINNNLKICQYQQQLLYVLQSFNTSNSANNSNKVELD